MTNRFREYRGLHGETVRVLAHTITETSRYFSGGSFPFVSMAKRLGQERDRFAYLAMQSRPWYEGAIRERGIRTLVARAEPLPA
jgi:hypothetical protein